MGSSRSGPTPPVDRVPAMRALITGGLGFVGRHLSRHLRDNGVDVTDGPAVMAAITTAAPDAVYHLAGWADVGASWSDPVGVFRANAEGSLHVLRACVEAKVERVLAISSADLYGIVTADELPLR